MVNIAAEAGITKVTLYRYFANRDVIALEIHVRMMNRIGCLVDPEGRGLSFENAKELVRSMIRNFSALRDAYRYMGMFDRLYLDNPLEPALAQWTKSQLVALPWNGAALARIAQEVPQGDHLIMVMSTVIWFLEKLALRGELTWSDQAVPLEEHLALFEEMIISYIDRTLQARDLAEPDPERVETVI